MAGGYAGGEGSLGWTSTDNLIVLVVLLLQALMFQVLACEV